MNPLKHVHIEPQGSKWCLKTGLYKSSTGWQTAEAAKLNVETRREDGTVIWNCLDNLSRRKAEELAVKLDEWMELQEQPSKRRRVSARREEVEEKYRKAMGGE